MKRLLAALLVSVAGVFVFLFPVPDTETGTTTTAPPTADESAIQDARTVAHCPWARTDASIASDFSLAALGPFEATVTASVSGEVGTEVTGGGLAFGLVPLTDVAGPGVSSAVVEFSDRPSGAVVVARGESVLASAGCRSGASKVWLLAGGSTLADETLELRLFNPFPQPARLQIRVTSENDSEPEPTLETITVNPRTTRAVNLSELLALRETLALSITDEDGLVTPVLTQTFESPENGVGDTAAWVGVGASSEWYFPFSGVGETVGSVVLMNDGAVPATYDVDVYTEDGSELGVRQDVLEPRTVARLPLSELHDGGAFGFGIRSDGPIGAFLTGEGSTQRAATPGASYASPNWLVPGPGGSGTQSTVWFLNAGSTLATVTYRAAQSNGSLGPAEKLAVPIGTVVSLAVDSGLVVRSSSPITVGWTATAPGSAAFTMGLPFSDG